ncbi:MAG TPA: cupin-like domain-containing protein [Polyangiaceae bacterium]|nr:cupin-like domain-containing protein [Polyangiaceae bacterium]
MSSILAVKPVERVRDLDLADFSARFELADRPCVMVGGASSWRATQTWNAAYLKQKLGPVEVRFKLSTTHMHPNFHQPTQGEMFSRGAGRFGEFLDEVTSGPRAERAKRLFTGDEQFLLQHRDGQTTINEALRPLLDDVEVPPLVPQGQLYTVWGWFSGSGVRTWLHYDNNGCHNLNAQITGQKRCLLFAPSELSRMAPFPLGGPNPAHNCSQIDVEAPDLERFPAFRGANCFEADLEPGDLLFIPAWWFHTFSHTGELNSNVNFWWKPKQPVMNEVAARQMLIDIAAAAKAKLAGAATPSALLEILDRAAIDKPFR